MSGPQPTNKTPLVPKKTDDSLQRVKAQVSEVQSVMSENMQAAMDRGENLNALHERTDQLEYDSRNFKQRSSVVRRRFCVSYYRTLALIFIVLVAFIGLIVYLATS